MTFLPVYSVLPHQNFRALSPNQCVVLMRRRRVTIRQLALANNLPMTRVRQIRETGRDAGFPSWEFHRMVEIANLHS
jgi:hypothetical protein